MILAICSTCNSTFDGYTFRGPGCFACRPSDNPKCPRCGQPLRRTERGGLVCDRWDCKVTEEVKA
jgi:hypothetical protein